MRIELSTRRVADHQRVEFWRSAMQQALNADCRVEPATRGAFEASMNVMDHGTLNLVEISGSPYRTTRFGPGRPGMVSVMFQLDGMGGMSDGRRQARLAPGEACIVPPDRDIVAERFSGFRQVLVNVATDPLDDEHPGWRERMTTRLQAERPPVRMAVDLVRYLADYDQGLDACCRRRLGETVACLVDEVVAEAVQSGGTSARAGEDSSRMANYHRQRIQRFVLDRLRDPGLSVSLIAAELGLSVRYVHKLFERQPQQVMQWAQQQRLQACRSDLARRGTRPIADIAFDWGFSSPAHFSRAFKRQFGVRPSDL